jgi:hypothetical protein
MSRLAVQHAWPCLAHIRRMDIPNLLDDLDPFLTALDESMQQAGHMDQIHLSVTGIGSRNERTSIPSGQPSSSNQLGSTVRWPSGLRRQLKVLSSDASLIRWSERAWVQIPLSSIYLLLFVSHIRCVYGQATIRLCCLEKTALQYQAES